MPPAAQRAQQRRLARCGGCGRAATPWCERCAARLGNAGGWATLRCAPSYLPPVRVAGRYGWTLRRAILAYKERGRVDLAEPLGAALGAAIRAALDACPDERRTGRELVVPVPASSAGARGRGFDHVALLVGHAGYRPSDLLAWHREALDQAGLDAAARAANLADALKISMGADHRLAGACGVVLVDDVVTTGATLGEAARALHHAGVPIAAAAALAATRPGPLPSPAGIATRGPA